MDMSDSSPEAIKEEGLRFFNEGNRKQALALFQDAAEAFAAEGDVLNQAEMFNNMGVIYRMDRKWQKAEDSLMKAKSLFSELRDDVRLAQVLGNLGDLKARQRKFGEAEQFYSESSVLLKASGQYQKQADVLRALSIMQIRQRSWWAAVDTLNKSLKVRPHPSLLQRLLSAFLGLALRLASGGH